MADCDIWVLYGRNAGDNRQVAALAEATGLRWEARQLVFNELSLTPSLLLQPTLATLTRESRALLAGPPPRFVFGSGRRTVPVARWLRRRSEGRTSLVHVGRPWTPLSWFDLIVTTPQYGLPDRPNVVTNLFTLGAGAREPVAPRTDVEALPRPRLGVLVGGDSHPLTLDAETASQLARHALARAAAEGGSAMFVTGPRTSPVATAALAEAVSQAATPARLYVYGRSPDDYAQVLSAADRLIVTGDSAAMIAEAATAGAPLEIFPLRECPHLRAVAARAGRAVFDATPFGRMLFRRMLGAGLVAATRDLGLYAARLREAGLLEGGDAARRRAEAELAAAAERIRRLRPGAEAARPVRRPAAVAQQRRAPG